MKTREPLLTINKNKQSSQHKSVDEFVGRKANKRLTIDIPASLHKAFKNSVGDKDKDMASAIRRFIKKYIEENK